MHTQPRAPEPTWAAPFVHVAGCTIFAKARSLGDGGGWVGIVETVVDAGTRVLTRTQEVYGTAREAQAAACIDGATLANALRWPST